MFDHSVARELIAAAKAHGIEPAALLAIVEVETGGKLFEDDGRTPQFLYERHIAWKEAMKKNPQVHNAFRGAGLAIPQWSRATQYRDQRTSAQRMALMAQAKSIDEDVALRSASWGLGQTMGFLAEGLGFACAHELVAHQTGSIQGQIDCLIRELRHSNLIKSMNAHDWVRVARIYNGARYAENQYDIKLRDAYRRWARKVNAVDNDEPPPPEQSLARDEIRFIQTKLRELGYHEVGSVDGYWGPKLTGAISAFQHHEGLAVNGHFDDATKAALDAAELPRPVDRERSEATVDDLRNAGSDTIKHADDLSSIGTAKKVIGGTLVTGGVLEQGGWLDKITEYAQKASDARYALEGIHNAIKPFLDSPAIIFTGVALLAAGIVVAIVANRIKQNRLRDHQAGEHAGPSPCNTL